MASKTFSKPRRRLSLYQRKTSNEPAAGSLVSNGRRQRKTKAVKPPPGLSAMKRTSQFGGSITYEKKKANSYERSQRDKRREDYEGEQAAVYFENIDSDVSDSDMSDDLDYVFNPYGTSSDEEETWDDDEDAEGKKKKGSYELAIYVTVDDGSLDGTMKPMRVPCGNGANTFKWLSTVAMNRYYDTAKSHGRLRSIEHCHVHKGSFNPLKVQGQTVSWPPSKYISPKMRIVDVLDDGDHCTITLNAQGHPNCWRDGRSMRQVTLEDSYNMFHGDAFIISEKARSKHEERKALLKARDRQRRATIMARAAEEFFGKGWNCESKNKNSQFKRISMLEKMFQKDWEKLSFHGQIRRSQIEPVRTVLETNFEVIHAVFKKFACMGADAVFRKATKSIRHLLEADRGTLWVADFEKNLLTSKVAEKTGMLQVPLNAGIVGAVVASGETINIKNAYDDPRFNREVDFATNYRTVSMLTCPTLDSNLKPNGALQVVNKINKAHAADVASGKVKAKKKNDPLSKYCPFTIHDQCTLYDMGIRVGLEIEELQSSNSEDTMSEMSYVEFTQFTAEINILDIVHVDTVKDYFFAIVAQHEDDLSHTAKSGTYVEQHEILRHHFIKILVWLSGKLYEEDFPGDSSVQIQQFVKVKLLPLVKSSMGRDVREQMLLEANSTYLLKNIEIFKKLFRLNAVTVKGKQGVKIKNLMKIIKPLKIYNNDFTRETVRAMFFMYQEEDLQDTNSDEKLLADSNVDFGQFLMIMCEIADRVFGRDSDLLANKLRHLVHRLRKRVLHGTGNFQKILLDVLKLN
jgi:hypothetical protein